MPKITRSAAILLALVGCSWAANGWAADMPVKAQPAAPESAPRLCTDFWDFIATNCQLTWHGITVYGTIDAGVGWQSHGAPLSPWSAPGASYLIQKMNRSPMFGLAPNALSQSFIGLKGTEPIGNGFSFVFDWNAGFDPYSLRFANGPHSLFADRGVPLNQQDANADSSRAGQWYNNIGYVGISSPTYGTLTVFRQNSLTNDGVLAYDPLGGSYAFSPIGFQGITCGVGDTETCRYSTSAKYKLNIGQFRVAGLVQFGGYAQNNASDGAYQLQIGGDVPHLANGTLSVDAIFSFVRDAVSASLAGAPTNAVGVPIAPFLPQTFTATISDDSSVMLLGKYANGPLTLYGGYEWIRFAAPSDPQVAFTDISGDFVCLGCAAINMTNINNTAFEANGLGTRILQSVWIGAKYAITKDLDVMGGYYHYIQNSFFGTAAKGPIYCADSSHSQCAGTFDAVSAVIDWRFAPKWDTYFGVMFSQETGGLANGFLTRNNIDPTVGVRFRF